MKTHLSITIFTLTVLLASCQQVVTPLAEQKETLIVTSTEYVPLPTTTATSPATPTIQPSPSPTPVVFENLDQDAKWEVYPEGSPKWFVGSVTTPAIDGHALRCSITGGSPYSNVHCYRNLPSEPTANTFTLTLSFWFSPKSSCNNQGNTSIVQALEFTMNKWYQSQRYEFALQWQNVGDGAPQWRYWNPHASEKWVPLNPTVAECLEGERWHTITLEGVIANEQVYYKSFTINNQIYQIDLTIPPVSTPGEVDRLAVAVQLDGNTNETPYDMFVDEVTFIVKAVTP